MIKRIAGVFIPPKKAHTFNKVVTIPFVITGSIPSKKNLNVPVARKSFAWKYIKSEYSDWRTRKFSIEEIKFVLKRVQAQIVTNDVVREWNETWAPQLITQASAHSSKLAHTGLIFPIKKASITIVHYWADNLKRDNSNKAETIFDLLTAAHIIEEDSWQHLHKFSTEANLYKGEILDHITTIHITSYL